MAMAMILVFSYWLLTLALLPFFGFMALVTASAFLGRRSRIRPRPAELTESPRLLVVIPAHDEEGNVGATVASCLGSSYDPARFCVWVIADNCSDETAFKAREAGAEVFQRTDDARRSKGYALEDFLATRRTREPESGQGGVSQDHGYDFDAAIVIDADTVIDPSLLSSIAQALGEGADWVQCYYTVRNPDASWRTRLLTYAFSLYNGVWLLGQDTLGLGSGFRGNGMALSARGLARVPWKAYGLVEDQEFSWMLRTAGERVRFLPDARVYGEMVTRGRGSVTQRRRWEEGRRSLRAKFFWPILTSRNLSIPHKLLDLLDLFIPPLMPLLAAFLFASTSVFLVGAVPGLVPLIPLLALMALTFVLYALSPFFLLGLPLRYLASFPMVPYYAVWKLFTTFRSRTTSWVRTEREASAKGPG
jgi:1,2-diacylglycerol 3-beta-glucosyltransferase